MRRLILFCTLILFPLFALPLYAALPSASYILYLMQQGEISKAIAQYRKDVSLSGRHDLHLLREMGLLFLNHSPYLASSPEAFLTALFGVGVARDRQLMGVLRAGAEYEHPQLQAAAVTLLAELEDDEADQIILETLSSPFLGTRLESCFQLASKRHPRITLELDNLMSKVIPELYPLFPQFYAMVHSVEADRTLRRFLASSDLALRRATILSLAKEERDDFLPEIRKLALHLDPLQQEVCAMALGELKDAQSWDLLERMSRTAQEATQLSAFWALYQLGKTQVQGEVAAAANRENLFAIRLLGKMEGSEQTLATLLESKNIATRVNATLSLLELRDSRCVKKLAEILIPDSRDMGLIPQTSPGGALSAFRPLFSLSAHSIQTPEVEELSCALRESIIAEAVELPEDHFLELAQLVFRSQQNDLIPTLVALLEGVGTPKAIALLQRETEHIGAPLIRDYSNLALYRSHEKGPYQKYLHEWLLRQKDAELFRLRPLLSWDKRQAVPHAHVLTPEETSRLMVESFEALARRQDEAAIDALLEALQNGNPFNQFALAGLLVRVTD